VPSGIMPLRGPPPIIPSCIIPWSLSVLSIPELPAAAPLPWFASAAPAMLLAVASVASTVVITIDLICIASLHGECGACTRAIARVLVEAPQSREALRERLPDASNASRRSGARMSTALNPIAIDCRRESVARGG
jgi:hypothetical protein